jgi:hypothetical protein
LDPRFIVLCVGLLKSHGVAPFYKAEKEIQQVRRKRWHS